MEGIAHRRLVLQLFEKILFQRERIGVIDLYRIPSRARYFAMRNPARVVSRRNDFSILDPGRRMPMRARISRNRVSGLPRPIGNQTAGLSFDIFVFRISRQVR